VLICQGLNGSRTIVHPLLLTVLLPVLIRVPILLYKISDSIKRRRIMAGSILWETDMTKAMARAKAENKPVLLDFFDPN
jgi:hypothetical protein